MYEAKRMKSEAGIATSEFSDSVVVAVLALPLKVAEVGVGTLRAELMMGEVVGSWKRSVGHFVGRFVGRFVERQCK
jgi:hypothetical protein